MEEVLQAYVAAWGETDQAKRRALLEKAWDDDGVYQDPSADVQGREALVAHKGGFHQSMPGARIELATDVSRHHGNIYFAWKLVTADGSIMIEGVDFGMLAADRRISRITGVFGPPGA